SAPGLRWWSRPSLLGPFQAKDRAHSRPPDRLHALQHAAHRLHGKPLAEWGIAYQNTSTIVVNFLVVAYYQRVAPVVKWISQQSSELSFQVRVLAGALEK